MNPLQPQQRQQPTVPQRPMPTPAARTQADTQHAAADVIRGQINSIYNGGSTQQTPHTTPVAATTATAQPPLTTGDAAPLPSHAPAPASTTASAPATQSQPSISPKPAPNHGLQTAPPQASSSRGPQATPEQWQQYHTAWQKYYQLYYERYYANHLSAQQAHLLKQQANTSADTLSATDIPESFDGESLQQKAIRELRAKIRQTVRHSTQKVTKSRHFMPAIAGLSVMLLFTFLQYNRVIFGAVAAYTSPGNIDPQNIIVDPAINVKVGPEPRLIIPKINVDAPIVYGAPADIDSQRRAMEKGVAHFSVKGASAIPGQLGNTVLAAHSSNDAFAAGDYKFIFAQNEKLQQNDVIYVNHEGTRYTYKVTRMEVVLPHEVDKIQIGTDKAMLTLISCVPIGTAEKRLLVFAEQISPEPATAAAASDAATSNNTEIPGKPNATLLERLFGGR